MSSTKCTARLEVVDDEGTVVQTVMVLDDALIHWSPMDGYMLGEHEVFEAADAADLVPDLQMIGHTINTSFEGRWADYTARVASA
jgi:hypothetical protein